MYDLLNIFMFKQAMCGFGDKKPKVKRLICIQNTKINISKLKNNNLLGCIASINHHSLAGNAAGRITYQEIYITKYF